MANIFFHKRPEQRKKNEEVTLSIKGILFANSSAISATKLKKSWGQCYLAILELKWTNLMFNGFDKYYWP